MGRGWQPLFGHLQTAGFSIEWHDFSTDAEFDWAPSFHPDCLELCLNFDGCGFVEGPDRRADFTPNAAGFYRRREESLEARRFANQRHQFITVEFSSQFLAKYLGEAESMLHPVVLGAMGRSHAELVSGTTTRLTSTQRQIAASLRRPPVSVSVQPLWYHSKALELAATFLCKVEPASELFCTRQQRLAQDRVEQVIALLKKNLAEPPTLEGLGRQIGCSPFYLSRIFSSQTGQTITQYVRQLRLEKAAELLRSGEYNVTEAALEVGYSSMSHFSSAFHQAFGCCPGLYPLAPRHAKAALPPSGQATAKK